MVDRKFFERPATEVALHLVGRTLNEFIDRAHIIPHGLLIEVGAYDESLKGKMDELFTADAGQIGTFGGRGGYITVISAHQKGQTGLVTLRQAVLGDRELGQQAISRIIASKEKRGQYVGKDSGLYIGESGINLAEQGLVIVNQLPPDAAANMTANFKLVYK